MHHEAEELRSKIAAALREGHWQHAAPWLERWCELFPSEPRSWFNRGLCLAHLGRLQDAVHCLDRSLELDSGFAKAGSLRAQIIRQLQQSAAPQATESIPAAAVPEPDHLPSARSDPDGAAGNVTEALPAVASAGMAEVTSPLEGEELSADALQAWRKGSVVAGRYEVRAVARGGMGVVYLAYDRELQRMVAVKTPLPSALATEDGRARFYREAEAWIALGIHPNICTAYYVQEIGGIPRLFIEYVDGGDLDVRLRKWESLTAEQRLDIAIQIARGLHHTHTLSWTDPSGRQHRGLVHRDLKPANVLMTADGTARVTDFGLVRAGSGPGALPVTAGEERSIEDLGAAIGRVDDDRELSSTWQTLTMAGGVIGTPPYVAPEVWQGTQVSGTQSDIYAFGCMLYEIFCGRRPFLLSDGVSRACREHQLLEWLKAHLMEPPPHPAEIGFDMLDPVLCDTMLSCLAKNPAARPGSFAEILDALVVAHMRMIGTPYQRPEPHGTQLLADSLNNRAVSYMTLGHTARAEAAWQHAHAADLRHREVTYNLALYEWQAGRLTDAEALRRMDEVQRGRQLGWRDYHLRGKLHLTLDDPAQAVPALRQAAADGDASYEGQRDLGTALLALAREQREPELLVEAAESFRSVLDMVPLDLDATVGLTAALRLQGRQEEAEQLWTATTTRYEELPAADQAVQQLLPAFTKRHSLRTSGMAEVVLAATGDRIVCRSGSTRITTWCARTGSQLGSFEIPGGAKRGRSAALSADADRLAATGEGLSLAVWELSSGHRLLRCEPQPSFVTAVAISPDGRWAVTGGADRAVRLWDLDDGRCTSTFSDHKGYVTAAAFLPHEPPAAEPASLISACGGGELRLWSLSTGECRQTFQGHFGAVTDVVPAAGGALLVSAGQDGSVRVWEVETGQQRYRWQGHHGPVTAVVAPAGGELVLSAGEDGTVRFWSIGNGQLQHVLRFPNQVTTLAVSADARTAAAGQGANVEVLELLGASRHRTRFALTVPITSSEMEQRQRRVDERLQAARQSLDCSDLQGAVTALDAARAVGGFDQQPEVVELSRQILARCPRATLRDMAEERRFEVGDERTGALAVYLPDGTRAVTGGGTGPICLLDLAKGENTGDFSGHAAAVTSLAVSPDGSKLVGTTRDGSLHLWSLASGRHQTGSSAHQGSANAAAISARGDLAVSAGSDGAILGWRLDGDAPMQVLGRHDEAATAVATSADNRLVVSGGWDHMVMVWELSQRVRLRVLEGHGAAVAAVAVSPDCRCVASAAADGTVRLWDIATGRCLRIFADDRRGESTSDESGKSRPAATCVAFTPDARFLLSGDREGQLRVWDVRSANPLRTIDAHTTAVNAVGISPDGFQALSTGADGKLRLWSLDWQPEPVQQRSLSTGVRPFLEVFLRLRTPAGAAPSEVSDSDLQLLMADLAGRGFGGIGAQQVRQQLEKLAQGWQARQLAEQQSIDQQHQRQVRQERTAPVRRVVGALTRNLGIKLLVAAALVVVLLLLRQSVRTPLSDQILFNSSLRQFLGQQHAAESTLRKTAGFVVAYHEEPTVITDAASADCLQTDRQRHLEVVLRPEQYAPVSVDPQAHIGNDAEFLRSYRTAMICLPQLADGAVVEALLEAVAKEPPAKRNQDLITLLVQIGDPAIPQLERALSSSLPNLRHTAASALAEMRTISSVTVLIDALLADSFIATEAASTVLQQVLTSDLLPAEEAFQLVARLAADLDPGIRRNALYGLAVFQETRPVAELFEAALEDADDQVRQTAEMIRSQIRTARLRDLVTQ